MNIGRWGFILGHSTNLAQIKADYKERTREMGAYTHKQIRTTNGFHIIDQEGRNNPKSGIVEIEIPPSPINRNNTNIYFYYEKSWGFGPPRDNLIIHYRFSKEGLVKCIESVFCGLDSPHTHYLTGNELGLFIKEGRPRSMPHTLDTDRVACGKCGEKGPLRAKCKNSMIQGLIDNGEASWHICDLHYELYLHEIINC